MDFTATVAVRLFFHPRLDFDDGCLEFIREFFTLGLFVERELLALVLCVLEISNLRMCALPPRQESPGRPQCNRYLDALILFLQLSTQRLQLVFHAHGLLHLGTRMVFFLLQLVRTLARLCVVPF